MIDITELNFPSGFWLPPRKLDQLVEEHLGKKYDSIAATDEVSGNGELKIWDLSEDERGEFLEGWGDHAGGRKEIQSWLAKNVPDSAYSWEDKREAPDPGAIIAYLIEQAVLPEGKYYFHIDW